MSSAVSCLLSKVAIGTLLYAVQTKAENMQRDLTPTSLIDMAYMTNDSGFTAKYFYEQIKLGKLPPPIKFGRSSRWLLGDYTQWRNSHQRISL